VRNTLNPYSGFQALPRAKIYIYISPLCVCVCSWCLVLSAFYKCQKMLRQTLITARNLTSYAAKGTMRGGIPRRVVERVTAITVPYGAALRCLALQPHKDPNTGIAYAGGEEYLELCTGMYFPKPYEKTVTIVEPERLGRDEGLHVKVSKRYTDPRLPFLSQGVTRTAGDVFLVTGEMCSNFILHPYDVVVSRVERIRVSSSEYCVVLCPVVRSKEPHIGRRRVLTNTTFFLQPGETLESGMPKKTHVLAEGEAILLEALCTHDDTQVSPVVVRRCGARWLVQGPCSLIPTASTRIVPDADTGAVVRCKHTLGEGEGLYVRHCVTGIVRCVSGPCSYLLGADEELWEKPLSADVEKHLNRLVSHSAYVDVHKNTAARALCGASVRAVAFYVPHRSVTQLFNYTTQTTRTVFGPDHVLLEPDEAFTVVSLSGSPWDPAEPNKCLPKQPHHITALYLFLGPSNTTDVVHVETRDHAQLALQLCYDWFFDIDHGDCVSAQACFRVSDFVGDSCSFIASRIRAAVASMPFEEFHKNNTRCLKRAVFGVNAETGEPEEVLRFPANRLVITSVDIQKMDVLDERTRQGLQKSVKMAIEITTHAQEAEAQQIAMAREQQAKGLLERQRMEDQVANEEQRRILLDAEVNGLAIVSSGKSRAIAEAASTAAHIEGEAVVKVATIRATKECLLHSVANEMQSAKQRLLTQHEEMIMTLAQEHQRQLQNVQHTLMAAVIAALGSDTIEEIAKAGPELQVKLLQSLGLEGYLVTDGSSPINLFNTAASLTGK